MSESAKHGEQFVPERKAFAEALAPAAEQLYRRTWSVRTVCHVEHGAGVYDNFADEKGLVETLDYASIDCIIDTFEKQMAVHERWIKPDAPGTRFALRCDTGSSTAAEADKLIAALDDETMLTPGLAAYGKARRDDPAKFKWFRIVNLSKFMRKWQHSDEIAPDSVWTGDDGTGALLFDTDTLDDAGVLIADYSIDGLGGVGR